MSRFLFFITVWCFLSPTLFADTQQNGTESQVFQLGIEGVYKNGLWTPLRLDVPNPAQPITVTCSDADGVPVAYRFSDRTRKSEISYHTSDGSTGTEIVYIKLGRANAPITVQFGDNAPQRFTVPPPVSAERPLFLIIGNEDIGLQGAVAELALKEEQRPVLVKVKSFKDLPGEWFGYEAVDTVFLTTTEPKQFEGLTSDSPQIQALERWVKLGGTLVFCAGKDAEPLVGQPKSPLSPFLPGKFSEMTELRNGKALESFIASKRMIFMNGTDEAPFLKMPRFAQEHGIVFAQELDLPLVLRCAHGLGVLVYFGGDLSGRPLSVWRDRVQFVKKVLQWDTERKTGSPKSEMLIQLGYNDMTGQVRSALDRFDGVWILPFSLVLIILVCYWLFIGPVDWLFVKKILGKPQWTWFTFPIWIVLFCVLAWYVASLGRPNRIMLNELQLTDYDSFSGTERTSVWANLYSPADARYSLTMQGIKTADSRRQTAEEGKGNDTREPDSANHVLQQREPDSVNPVPLFSWNGLTGSGLGGMNPKTVSPSIWSTGSLQEWETDDSLCCPSINEVPVAVRSTKSFFGQLGQTDKPVSSSFGFQSALADEEGIPVGTLKLPETMPEMENVLLAYERWVLELGTMKPGQEIEMGKTTKRRELRELLLSRNALEDATLRRLSSYNAQSTDWEYIIPVLSLHTALGGMENVGLNGTFRRSLDLSGSLTADRVVLLGKPVSRNPPDEKSLITVLKDGQKQPVHLSLTSVYRQLLPIKLTALSPRLRRERVEPERGGGILENDGTIKGVGEYELGE